MPLKNLSTLKNYRVRAHDPRADGDTCPKYIRQHNFDSVAVVMNDELVDLCVSQEPDSVRVSFGALNRWYFIDNHDLNQAVRDRRIKGQRFRFSV